MSDRIYIASRTVHAPWWRALRAAGAPIVSSWIDEAGSGQTTDWGDLWRRCLGEIASATALILYQEDQEEVLRGALVEVGAALASRVPVLWVGWDMGSITKNPLINRVGSLEEALKIALGDPR